METLGRPLCSGHLERRCSLFSFVTRDCCTRFRRCTVATTFTLPVELLETAKAVSYTHLWTPVVIAAYLFALLAATLSNPEIWWEAYAFGRTLTPLVLLAALDGLNVRSILPALGLLLIDPRIGLQLGPQILKIVGGVIR